VLSGVMTKKMSFDHRDQPGMDQPQPL